MNKITKNILWGFFIVLSWLVMYGAYYEAHKEEVLQKSQLAALLDTNASVADIKEPIKFSECQANGPLPDPDCTPGAVFENTPLDVICTSGYTKTVRNVSQKTKEKIFAMYGIESPVPFGSYEIDHLIPLSLGGSNDIANLWPKAAEPFPGFYEKNITGNYLYQQVCAGNIALNIAQQRIASDWYLVYQALGDETIKALKGKYKNWAN